MERLIKFTAGEIRRVIRRYGPWAAGKREAFSPDDGETARNFTAGDNSRWETEWHQAVVYDHLAEYASEKLFKGNGVYVRGYLKTVKTTGRDGVDRYTVWVVGEELQSNATKTKENDDKNKQAPQTVPTNPPRAQP